MTWGKLLLPPLLFAGLSCTDYDHFSTGAQEAYCGAITLGKSFRKGFSPRVQMRLVLETAAEQSPFLTGTLSTYEAQDSEHPARRLLHEAELSVIPELENDPLSHLEFGQGRLKNLVFSVSPRSEEGTASSAEGSLLAILSLRTDDSVEVRLLRPGPTQRGGAPVPEGQRPLFGVFALTRQMGTCGF